MRLMTQGAAVTETMTAMQMTADIVGETMMMTGAGTAAGIGMGITADVTTLTDMIGIAGTTQ